MVIMVNNEKYINSMLKGMTVKGTECILKNKNKISQSSIIIGGNKIIQIRRVCLCRKYN